MAVHRSSRFGFLLLAMIALGLSLTVFFSQQQQQTQQQATGTGIPSFSHVFVIMYENHSYSEIIGNSAAPYINQIANQYGSAANFMAIAHPSLPNYLAFTAGSTLGVTTDCNTCFQTTSANIFSELEAVGKTWKSYNESMTGNCYLNDSGTYVLHHNPAAYFLPLRTSCAKNDVPYSQFAGDLNSGNVGAFNFIVPNISDNMHTGTIQAGDTWLKNNLPQILSSSAYQNNGLVVFTFDEGDKKLTPNQIVTLVISPLAKQQFKSNTPYTLYSLLRTISDGLGIQAPANAANATPMTDFFNGTPVTGTPTPTIPHVSVTPNPTSPVSQCNDTGVMKNTNGTYSFASLRVDAGGNIVDSNNCLVHLLGLNQGWLASGDAGYPTAQEFAQWRQILPYNIVRLNYNSYYWNNDVFVPNYNIHFREHLQNYVKAAEANGFYVELDTGPQHPEPPCGGSVTFCSSQDQGSKDYAANPNPQTAQELVSYPPPGDQSLTDLTKLYANDPAVIFDVWNEPGNGNFNQLLPDAQFFPAMQHRIAIVNTNAPQALVVVYAHDIAQMLNGKVPPYQGNNIVIDHHTYSAGFTASQLLPNIQFYRQHGWGTVVNEYGGSTASAPALQALSSLAKQYDIGLAYFSAENLVTGNTVQLNSNGQLVQNAYTNIFATSLPTGVLSVTPHPSQQVTPTTSQRDITFSIAVCPHGLGNCGDNANPNGSGNMNPKHQQRTVTLTFLNAQNQPVGSSWGTVSYNSSTGNFQGSITGNIPNGQYVVRAQTNGFLPKQTPGIITVTSGQTIPIPLVALTTGDINNDGQLDILDYNLLIGCFGSKQQTASCTTPPTVQAAGADIDDDGTVGGADYNLFLRELSVQHGG